MKSPTTNRQRYIAALLFPVLTSNSWAATSSLPAATDTCRDMFKTGAYFEEKNYYSLPGLTQALVHQDQYETTAAFKKRLAEVERADREGAATKAEAINKGGPIKVKKNLDNFDYKYNADKGVLEFKSWIRASASTVEIPGLGKHKFFHVELSSRPERETIKTEGPYSYKQTISESFHVGYMKGIKDKRITEGKMSVPLSVEQAKAVSGKLAIAFAGKIVPPYRTSSGFGSFGEGRELSVRKYDQKIIMMDIDCAAIIDRTTNEIIHQIR